MTNTTEVSPMEKHVRTALAILITGMCFWIIDTLANQTIQTAVLSAKMDSIQLDIAELKENSKTYVSLSAAADAHNIINHRLDQLNLQVRAVELTNTKSGS